MPKIIDSAYSESSFDWSFQRKLFHRAQKFYIFWADKINGDDKLFYRVADTISALATADNREATSVGNSGRPNGPYYDVHFDHANDRVAVAWARQLELGDPMGFFFKCGTFNADGTIDWQAEHRVDTQDREEYAHPVIGCSASGKWGVMVRRKDGGQYSLDFYSAASGTPSATGDWSDRGNIPTGALHVAFRTHRVCQLGTSGEDMLLVYKIDDHNVGAKRWNGSAVGAEKVLAARIHEEELSAPVTDSAGDVQLIFIHDRKPHSLYHVSYHAAGDIWGTAVEIPNSKIGDIFNPGLQLDVHGSLHVTLEERAAEDDYRIHYLRRMGGSWSNETANLTGDLAGSYKNLRNTPCMAIYDETKVLIGWTNSYKANNRHVHEIWMDGMDVPVLYVAPTAEFEANPTSGQAPLAVQFTDKSTAGSHPITSWQWDFGDGGSSTEKNPSHIYRQPNRYTVSLTVSDGTLSDTERKSQYLEVIPKEDECKAGRFLSAISYLLGWLTGIIVLLIEKKNRCTRFHAWQSILTFIPLSILFLILNGRVSTTAFYIFLLLCGLLWLILLITAAAGRKLKLPVIGNIAERLANR